LFTASNVTVIINNEYVSEGKEVSRAGLEKEIIVVKSENSNVSQPIGHVLLLDGYLRLGET